MFLFSCFCYFLLWWAQGPITNCLAKFGPVFVHNSCHRDKAHNSRPMFGWPNSHKPAFLHAAPKAAPAPKAHCLARFPLLSFFCFSLQRRKLPDGLPCIAPAQGMSMATFRAAARQLPGPSNHTSRFLHSHLRLSASLHLRKASCFNSSTLLPAPMQLTQPPSACLTATKTS